ncbi:MAG: YlxR family protein [Pseudomonadota bacterium]
MLRTCAGCREVGDPAALVRVVLGPSGEAVPDLAGSGFGRGAWVHPRTACLTQALPRGFSKSMKNAVHTSVAEFSSALRAQAERRAYSLVGAAFRARKAAAGSTAVRDAHAAGLVKLVLVACDARAAAETPWVDALVKSGKARAFGSKELLGRVIGRPETGVYRDFGRWNYYCARAHAGCCRARAGERSSVERR